MKGKGAWGWNAHVCEVLEKWGGPRSTSFIANRSIGHTGLTRCALNWALRRGFVRTWKEGQQRFWELT
jgi:hypothetical protein